MNTAQVLPQPEGICAESSLFGAKNSRPFVSIIVLCRNEKDFIAGCLDSLIANDYPKDRLEVLVADGMSQDGTRGIIESYSRSCLFLRLVDNPKRIPATAANEGIKVARGDLVMIVGAHAVYPRDYISKCVAYSQSYPAADNVGGVRQTQPRDNTVIGKSIAYVSSHRFGGGPAAYHRDANGLRWVDSVWGGCYRKEVFKRLGLYNEALIIGEDREFNQRLRGFGGKILLVPEIKCTYYIRSKLLEYCRWVFRMGFWPFYAGRLAGRPLVSLRNFVPVALVACLTLTFGASWFSSVGRICLGSLSSAYLLGIILTSARLVTRERDLRYLLAAPCIFGATHLLYGIGSIAGVLKPVPPARLLT